MSFGLVTNKNFPKTSKWDFVSEEYDDEECCHSLLCEETKTVSDILLKFTWEVWKLQKFVENIGGLLNLFASKLFSFLSITIRKKQKATYKVSKQF